MMQKRKPAVVLIAEDDKEMRSLLCDELYDLGVSIREAADGDEALRLVLDARPSLILTDLRMPAGGLDYIARLRTFAPGVPLGASAEAGILALSTFVEIKVVATGVAFTRTRLVERKLLPSRYKSSKYAPWATVRGETVESVGAPVGTTVTFVCP